MYFFWVVTSSGPCEWNRWCLGLHLFGSHPLRTSATTFDTAEWAEFLAAANVLWQGTFAPAWHVLTLSWWLNILTLDDIQLYIVVRVWGLTIYIDFTWSFTWLCWSNKYTILIANSLEFSWPPRTPQTPQFEPPGLARQVPQQELQRQRVDSVSGWGLDQVVNLWTLKMIL